MYQWVVLKLNTIGPKGPLAIYMYIHISILGNIYYIWISHLYTFLWRKSREAVNPSVAAEPILSLVQYSYLSLMNDVSLEWILGIPQIRVPSGRMWRFPPLKKISGNNDLNFLSLLQNLGWTKHSALCKWAPYATELCWKMCHGIMENI